MSTAEQTPTRPLLRYHGGKWMIAPKIIAQFPAHRTYCEPFGGGASVLLRKPRSHSECYNDMDAELVNLFRVVRDRGAELCQALELTPFSRADFVESYQPAADPLEQARRTVVRSYQGFGSNSHAKRTGFRTNARASGTSPSRDWMNFPDCLVAIIQRLRGVVIENRPAIDVMAAQDAVDTLHYVDPPYVHSTRMEGAGTHNNGYRHEMTDADHRELAAFLREAKGAVILSGYPCDLYDRELYADWQRVEFHALADGARDRTEVLWMRNVDHGLFAA